jgi:hypothetical protein
LVLDDTTNPKYGLQHFTRKVKLLTTGGFSFAYKVLLFLWRTPAGDYTVAVALWHRDTPSLNELALQGFSLLRNRYGFKPMSIIADAAFATDKLLKRLEDYGWPCVMRAKKNRKLDGTSVKRLIPRGYGYTQGELKNGVKLKVFRRKSHFLLCNRMLWDASKALSVYRMRWRIEEVFRVLKHCLKLKGCQQHSMRAQQVYVIMSLLLFYCLNGATGQSVYKAASSVNSGEINLEDLIQKRLFIPC